MYSKLSSNLIHSTVWRESNHVRIVWITMLAICDRNGVVSASVPGLADAAKVSIKEIKNALQILEAPDPYSRSKEYDGARISEMEGGWLILNYCKYRDKRDDDEEREKARLKKRRQREKAKTVPNCPPDCPPSSPPVYQSSTSAPSQLSASSAPAQELNSRLPAARVAAEPPVAEGEKKNRKLPDTDHHNLIAHWCDAWKQKHGKPCPYKAQGGRNSKNIKTLLDTFGIEEAKQIMGRYLACDDGFLTGHSLSMLVSQIEKFVIDPVNSDLDPDDARMLAEMDARK